MELELKTVYEVEGDFANVGGGRTLGIFDTAEEAAAAAVGCGSLDCGGDGVVNERLAIPSGDGGFYLLDGDQTHEIGVMAPSEAKANHQAVDGGSSFYLDGDRLGDLVLIAVRRKMATMQILRDLLPVDLVAAKRMVDRLPCVIGRRVTSCEAAPLGDALRAAGDIVEMQPC